MNYDLDTTEGMENARRWTLYLLSQIVEGGVWCVPRSFSIYRISHQTRTATKLSGSAEPGITRVLLALGWKVDDLS